MIALCVLVGGAVGAPARYLTDAYVKHRFDGRFPYGTLLVNVIGCLVLGLVTGAVATGGLSSEAKALLGTGFCGGLTTFSTFSVETVELWQGRRSFLALSYLVSSVLAGLAAAAVGYAVTG